MWVNILFDVIAILELRLKHLCWKALEDLEEESALQPHYFQLAWTISVTHIK